MSWTELASHEQRWEVQTNKYSEISKERVYVELGGRAMPVVTRVTIGSTWHRERKEINGSDDEGGGRTMTSFIVVTVSFFW